MIKVCNPYHARNGRPLLLFLLPNAVHILIVQSFAKGSLDRDSFNMAGMLFILFLLTCFCLLVFVSWLAARWARRSGRRGWPYGMAVYLAVAVLLFWDWLPMEMSYKDKCENEAGLTVYKTPEQWQQENPGVWETLTPASWKGRLLINRKNESGSLIRHRRNERFAEEYQTIRHWFTVVENRRSVIDLQNDTPVIVYVNFKTNFKSFMLDLKFNNFRFWMEKTGCNWVDNYGWQLPRAVTLRIRKAEELYITFEQKFHRSKQK
jgi:hypothetical protein